VIGRAIVRLDVRGIALSAILIMVAGVVIVGTPLGHVITERLAHPHSDAGRALLYQQATQRVWQSPILGYGGPLPPPTNKLLPNIGTQGQFWLVLISNGIPGVALFMLFFVFAFWRSRGAGSEVGQWAHVTLLIFFVQVWVYEFIPVEIHLYLIAAALCWRETLGRAAQPGVRTGAGRGRVGFAEQVPLRYAGAAR
jgi:polysaccharide biosynthesis protein PslJ